MSLDLLNKVISDLKSSLSHHGAEHLRCDERGIFFYDASGHMLASVGLDSRLPLGAKSGYCAGTYTATLSEGLQTTAVTLTSTGELVSA